MRELLIFALLVIALSAQACTEAIVATGVEATEMSAVAPGVSRDEVEKVLGPPIGSEVLDGERLDRYHYDMGIAPHPKGWAHPSLLYPEGCSAGMACLVGLLIYAGAQPYLIQEIQEAQRGILIVRYGPDDTVLDFSIDPRDRDRKHRLQALMARATAGDAAAYRQIYEKSQHADEWQRQCLAAHFGDALSQYYMGHGYEFGVRRVNEDRVQAYIWYSLAAANGNRYSPLRRDLVGETLAPAELAEAKRVVEVWRPDPDACGIESVKAGEDRIDSPQSSLPETPSLCRDVGGYEAYMKRTGKVCRTN